MKIVAIILNILLVGVVILLAAEEVRTIKGSEILLYLFFVTVPIINLIAFASSPGWIQMYFKRKALEEQKKIEALKSNDEQKQ